MSGPLALLLVLIAGTMLTWACVEIDAWLDRRAARANGDETARFAQARARIAAQQARHPTRLGHSRKDDHV